MTLFKTPIAAITGALIVLSATGTQAAEAPALQLEAKISLGNVNGRIDHMAVDLARQRLFIAALGNNSIEVVDLKAGKAFRSIKGFKEPQGVAYVPSTDTVYVASGGDGTVRLLRGADLAMAGQIELGDDADNVRLDAASNRLFVGYGGGGLAIVDVASSKKTADIPLGGHPESFQLDPADNQVYVNLPKARSIAVVDRESGKRTATWRMTIAGGNFPMAFEPAAGHVLVAFRTPAKLGVFAKSDGQLVANPDICGNADDIFVDTKRRRIYVSCGEGFVDVFDSMESTYRRIARVPTANGARTSLFVPELDRLLVAVRAAPREPAAVWIFAPSPSLRERP
jgi:DNA-binding beta-propeller fold protein YncE